MSNIILIISLCIFFLSSSSQSQTYTLAGNHDSLLIDGADNFNFMYDEDCGVEIIVFGTVEASVKVKDLVYGCGQAPESSYVWKKKIVKTGDVINLGESITTGPNGFAKFFLRDGSVIILKKNSSIEMDNDICDQPGRIRVIFGSLYTKLKKALGGGKYEAVTPRYIIGVRGTEFTLEHGDKEDIVKVYEGTVDANPRVGVLDKMMGTLTEKLNKINDDYQNGRITQEEYVQKADEFNKEVQDIQDNTFITVNAGQKCTVDLDGNITGPVPIGSGDDKWFENVFK